MIDSARMLQELSDEADCRALESNCDLSDEYIKDDNFELYEPYLYSRSKIKTLPIRPLSMGVSVF